MEVYKHVPSGYETLGAANDVTQQELARVRGTQTSAGPSTAYLFQEDMNEVQASRTDRTDRLNCPRVLKITGVSGEMSVSVLARSVAYLGLSIVFRLPMIAFFTFGSGIHWEKQTQHEKAT